MGDALLPPEMALRAEDVGLRKATMDAWATLVLAVLAGASWSAPLTGSCICARVAAELRRIS